MTPLMSLAPSDDTTSAELFTVARLIGEVAREAKADGTLVAWRARVGERQELDRRGAMTRLPPGTCARLLRDADGMRGVAGIDGMIWSALDHTPDTVMTAGIVEASGGRLTAIVALNRPSSAALARVRRVLGQIAPILRGYLTKLQELSSATDRADGLAAAIDGMDVGIALLDEGGQPCFVNAALQRLLARRDGLCLNGRRLAATQLAESIRLQSAISHVLNGSDGPAPVVSIRQAGAARPLLVAISRAPVPSSQHAATVQVFDPELELRPLLEPVCRLYRLTPVETRLTCLLADGSSLADAARDMRVREQTARSYLKQIFQKTDTKRQAELVWLMLKSGVRTARSCPVSFF